MAIIHFVTIGGEFDVECRSQETLLETLRRNDIPAYGILLLDAKQNFTSLTHRVRESDELWAYSLRNTDYSHLVPRYSFLESADPAVEIIESDRDCGQRRLIQLSRTEALDRVYESVEEIIFAYLNAERSPLPIQVALSPGGDGRILAECIHRLTNKHPSVSFHCVVAAVGFEDEYEHISHGIELAERFGFSYTALGVHEAAKLLGYSRDLRELSEIYKLQFPDDEPEILLTYWVQEVNFAVARQAGRKAIIMGYNQEDVMAERLYALLAGRQLSQLFPVKRLGEFDIIAPLARIPKRMLDALDVQNSLRNYRLRITPVGYLRSALYFLSYLISERLPALAEVLSGNPLDVGDGEAVACWLEMQRHT